MGSENAMKSFKAEHAEGIAAAKAEFVKFLREGDLPEEPLDNIALFVYVLKRGAEKPIAAGDLFPTIVSDGVYGDIEYWDNPKAHAALMWCPMCDGEGKLPKAQAPKPKPRGSSRQKVRGV